MNTDGFVQGSMVAPGPHLRPSLLLLCYFALLVDQLHLPVLRKEVREQEGCLLPLRTPPRISTAHLG